MNKKLYLNYGFDILGGIICGLIFYFGTSVFTGEFGIFGSQLMWQMFPLDKILPESSLGFLLMGIPFAILFGILAWIFKFFVFDKRDQRNRLLHFIFSVAGVYLVHIVAVQIIISAISNADFIL